MKPNNEKIRVWKQTRGKQKDEEKKKGGKKLKRYLMSNWKKVSTQRKNKDRRKGTKEEKISDEQE